jgi:hypothetical protein
LWTANVLPLSRSVTTGVDVPDAEVAAIAEAAASATIHRPTPVSIAGLAGPRRAQRARY